MFFLKCFFGGFIVAAVVVSAIELTYHRVRAKRLKELDEIEEDLKNDPALNE